MERKKYAYLSKVALMTAVSFTIGALLGPQAWAQG
jgi:hypothetical protein